MAEEEKKDNVSEVKTVQETAPKAPEPAAEAAPVETPEQINWRKFRDARDADRKAREEAEKKAKEREAEAQAVREAMAKIVFQQSQPQNANSQQATDDDLDPTDIPTGEQVKKYTKKELAAIKKELKDEVKEEMAKEKQAWEAAELPRRLKSVYPDIDKVCSPANFDYLEFHYPEVAAGLQAMPDGFDKWSNVYKAVKRFVNIDNDKDKAVAEANFSKPKSVSTPGVTQTGDVAPTYISDEKRRQNWQRMQRVMKGG